MATIVFDLDGTLADTSGDLIAAANAVLSGLGNAGLLCFQQDRETAFHGGRAMLTLGYQRLGLDPDSDTRNVHYDALLNAYGAAMDVHTQLFPGVEASLDRLLAAGHRLAVCTNKMSGHAETLLGLLGIADRFGAVVGADTLPVRKPDPAPYVEAVARAGGTGQPSLLIGDTDTDLKTARAAGVPCVLVTFGPAGERVGALEPDALLNHYDALPDLVGRLLSVKAER
ncbi:HAD-IA family hydrolase [Qingshengfaniella alkalisoli]|uniref:phosphoglycolate phosphatase n=1 Tax=Qingshengfaniella alkalisoli TaxID=2599296 RepID=A0A5B8IRC4_9RHOB|nr:HAD-IA family hydrolase [Qingshengfaniella alkalisoli]QDY68742.1 HAD-IA family hydrolase [Qingshengfaniella alkalisoli]